MRALAPALERTVTRTLAPWKSRIESKSARHGLAYPWWIPEVSTLGQLGCVAAALAQRDALVPPQWMALTLLLVGAGPTVQALSRAWVPWWAEGVLVVAATAWLLSEQPYPHSPADLAPALMMLFVAEVSASSGLVPGIVVGAVSLGLIGGFSLAGDLPGFTLNALGLLLALVVGYMLLWQTRALAAERRARGEERARATVAERERIAREIHDLVAHSLSVTLLHLNGARQAMREGDLADARDAMDDAERVGRQAMADIRRTVSTMTSGHSPTQPLPAASDIGRLVEDFAAAGLEVRYDVAGDPAGLQPGAGLGLYRITQEALSNVAKHTPTSPVDVTLRISGSSARLVVRNELDGTRPGTDDGGSGVPGMTARATGMGAAIRIGPEGGAWVVDVRLPLDTRCPLKSVAP